MKKLILLLLPVMLLSCKGVEQYRASIETLATDWDSVTASVNEFKNSLNADLAGFSKAAGELKVSDDVAAKLKPEQTAEWQAAQSSFTQALQAYAPIRTGVAEFSKTWDEKTAEVNALKEGLAAGKLEGDVAGQVAGLQTLVAQAKEMLAGWQTSAAAAKAQTQAAVDSMKAVYAGVTASAATMKK